MFQRFLQRLQSPESAPIWSLASAALFCVALVVVSIAGQLLAIPLLGGSQFPTTATPFFPTLGIAIACIINTIVIFQWVWRRAKTGETLKSLHLEPTSQPPMFVVILMALAGAYLIDLVGVLTNLKAGQIVPPSFNDLLNPNAGAAWGLAAIVMIVIQPIGEEITFHGLFYPAAANRFGNVSAIGLSAIVYVAFNMLIATPETPWYFLIQPLLMALWVGVIRAYTQSTRMAMVARAMFGLFFVLSVLILAR